MIFKFENYELDTNKFELKNAGKVLRAEPQTILVLKYLIENRNKVVLKSDLIEAIWKNRTVSDWAVAAAIKAARKVLNDHSTPRKFIHTIHGKGVRFIANVSIQEQQNPVLTSPTVTFPIPASNKTPQIVNQPSLIVIPFTDLNEGQDQQYFADGITEDLLTDLSKTSELSVASRNTSFSLKNQQIDIESIAKKLDVSHILEGSYRRQKNKIRLNVQLLDAQTRSQLWADRFEGSGDDIFMMLDDINKRIVRSLKLQFASAISLRGTDKHQAYDLCLRGRSEYYLYTPNHLASALQFFEQAAIVDPNYAEAYAYQSYCRTSNYVFNWPWSDPNLDVAVELARKAIELDDTVAIAHTRLGWALGFINQSDEAISSFERAIDLDKNNAEIWMAFGETMNRLGQPSFALPLLEKAFSIDNFVPPSWEFTLGHSYALLGNFDSAIDKILPVLERVPRFIPARVQLIRTYAAMGNIKEAKIQSNALAKFAPKYILMNAKRMFPYPSVEQRDQFEAALRLADFPI